MSIYKPLLGPFRRLSVDVVVLAALGFYLLLRAPQWYKEMMDVVNYDTTN